MNQPFAKFFLLLTCLAAWCGLVSQLYVLLNGVPGNGLTVLQAVGRFMLFFTIWTNLIVAVSLTIIIARPKSKSADFFTRPAVTGAITLYIAVVGVVYNVVLRSLWSPAGAQRVADELLHVVVPAMYLIYWWLFSRKATVQWKTLWTWLIFPAVYLAYAMLRGNLEGYYAYPFIDLSKHDSMEVARNCVLMLLVFLAGGAVIIWLGKRR